jgi:putative nucleotidyltransferase with HDIG domain
MAAQTVMERTAVREGAGAEPAQRPNGRFVIRLGAVFTMAALVPSLAAGFVVLAFLGGGVRDISIGAALAVLFLALMVLVRRDRARHELVELQSRTNAMKAGYESIVSVLCAALDLQDNVTQGHARRVSEIASVVAWQLGLRKKDMRKIEKAAILHDIGKIGVADAVLAKPGPLDDSEWAEMKRHPELGHQILSGIDFLRDAAEIVYAHHERYDGQGYPRALKGDAIPLGARVFAVVDAYDAMTSHRPYRKALPHQTAVDEIVRNANGQFDPDVVRAFLEAEKRGLLDQESRSAVREIAPAVGQRPSTPSAAGADVD